MNRIFIFPLSIFFALIFLLFSMQKIYGEEEFDPVLKQLEVLQKDIKTLEKAVYNQDSIDSSTSTTLSDNESDVLTKHLLKLSELEEQFKILTNNFEEINFRLDKLSSRITKIQTDNQVRFQDLENLDLSNQDNKVNDKKKITW